ncbi:hypothetical protein [Staphylococcus xylosus]|uniref:hypothetical protein n=1 Tax=Staphylococcus xylosus TaxID=1288 RepID=UPI0015C5805C|nr:hypothetical protein [Staphylococcus xylosus]NQD97460.1 hypothetical protein [Staphylococcus xylosus]
MINKRLAQTFELNQHRLNHLDINKLKINNKPICHIYKKHSKYNYLEIDFITCDWCLSSLGQATLQSRLNNELTFMWLRGYTLKLNYTSVGNMTIFVRGDDLAINYLLNEINKLTADDKYWQKYKQGNRMLEIDRNSHYVMPTHHIKGNTHKIS